MNSTGPAKECHEEHELAQGFVSSLIPYRIGPRFLAIFWPKRLLEVSSFHFFPFSAASSTGMYLCEAIKFQSLHHGLG
jgi:hypothetical protein